MCLIDYPLLFSSLLPLLLISQTSKEDLLQADFEGALKFFRVQLPKRYRAAENARRLMEQACNIKVREELGIVVQVCTNTQDLCT